MEIFPNNFIETRYKDRVSQLMRAPKRIGPDKSGNDKLKSSQGESQTCGSLSNDNNAATRTSVIAALTSLSGIIGGVGRGEA